MSDRATIVRELTSAVRELAGLESVILKERARLFSHFNDGSRNITTIKGEVDANVVAHEADVIELKGDIQSLTLWLAHHDHNCDGSCQVEAADGSYYLKPDTLEDD